MTTTKLIVETAFKLHKEKLLSRKDLVDIHQRLVNAAAIDNGYAEKCGLPFPGAGHEGATVSHNWCSPSRRGHTWGETTAANAKVQSAGIDSRAARVCKRCGQLGCVNKQGVIRPVELP